ncbi:hypothetical protein BH11ACT4_BH11ACT4_09180 [soil metagenome]
MFRKILAALGTAVLALGISAVAVAAPASATHPTAVGTASCDTTTGTFGITWRVSGDTGYAGETATITSAEISSSVAGEKPVTTTSLIGKTVKGAGYVEAVQQSATKGANYQLTVKVQWTNHSTGDLVTQTSNTVTPSGACVVPPKDGVDCSAITFVKGSPLDGSNYINATFIQNGVTFQMNAEINEVQAQDAAVDSPSHLYVLIHAPGGDVKYPLTVTERDSGVFTYHYSDYLSNQWTVHWIQYDGHNDHYMGDLTCGTPLPNTATAVVKISAATCKAPATLTYGATTFASFTGGTPNGTTGATSGTALTHYEVTATSDKDHTFSDGTTVLVLKGDLDPQLSGPDCIPAPTCIPGSAVSYTYVPATNSGRITVADVTNSTHVLCDPFWVTATSWKFTNATVWPQMLDVVQKLGPISAPGQYDYTAAVSCGQGDIYASFDSQPTPTATLDGPHNPFPEHFLHDMGFTGPNPTYVQQDPACASVKPTVGYELGACYPNGTAPNQFSSSNLTLVFDNSKSTVPVTFSVPSAPDVTSTVVPTPSIVRTVPPGQVVKVQTTPIWDQGGSYDVVIDGVYSVTIPHGTITVKPYPGCLEAKPGDPSHSNETCTISGKVLGSITVGLETGLVYSIDGPNTHISPVSTRTTSGLAAGDYTVGVAAAYGYTLVGASSWPLPIKIVGTTCGQLDTHPLVTPGSRSTALTCVSVGSYTLDSNPGVIWTVNGNPATAGTYQVSTTSTVTATATANAPGYGFEAGIPNPKTYTFTFTKPNAATCATQLTTLAYTGVTSSLWLMLAGGLVFVGIGGLLIARKRWVSGN